MRLADKVLISLCNSQPPCLCVEKHYECLIVHNIKPFFNTEAQSNRGSQRRSATLDLSTTYPRG